MADESVGAGSDELRLGLLGHWHPPVAPQLDASPDRQRNPGHEHDSPDRSEHRAVDGQAATPEDAQENDERQSTHAIQRDPTPVSSALLHAERGREPVDPENDPGDGDGGFQRVHTDVAARA